MFATARFVPPMRKLSLFALCLVATWPGWSSAQTALTNTSVTEAQIVHLFAKQEPILYYCETGSTPILDDLGDLDGDWPDPPGPSPGRITSAAWDIGGNRYLYAYQLTNAPGIDGSPDPFGNWDVAVVDHSSGLRIPLRHKQVIPVDYDGNNVLDTSFRLTDHACSQFIADISEDFDCTPFTGPFKVFTAATDSCSRSWSDYYVTYSGEVSNDEIVSPIANFGAGGNSAEFFVEYDPLCCAHGIVASSQVFGFVADAPPDTVEGLFLGGTSASIHLIAPVPQVLLVHGICEDEGIWTTFSQALRDSGYDVSLIRYAALPFSLPPNQYIPALEAALNEIPSDKVAVVAHSMGGLIARDYIRRQTDMGLQQKIAQLVTLGTPHHGTDLGRKLRDGINLTDAAFHVMFPTLPLDIAPNLSKWMSDCQGDRRSAQAITDMLPGSDYLNDLNYRGQLAEDSLTSTGWGTHPSEVLDNSAYYASIGGTASTCLSTDLLIWINDAGYHLNDGVVAAESAVLTNAEAFRASDLALPTASVTHTSHPAVLFCEVPYYEMSALGEKVASILLTSPAAPPVGTASAPVEWAERVSANGGELSDTPAIVDSVAAGTMTLASRTIPTTTLMRVMLASADARLTLRAPDSTIITPGDSGSGGITFIGQAGSGWEGYQIVDPQAGGWTFRIDGTASAALQYYSCLVSYASAAKARVSTQQVIHGGGTIQVRAELDVSGVRQTDVAWSCLVMGPSDAASPLTLADDGLHGDGASGDGVFGGVATPADGFGLYRIAASGELPSGESFAASYSCQLSHNNDLSVAANDISFVPNLFNAGDSVEVHAIIRNGGSEDATDAKVSVRDRRTGGTIGVSTTTIQAGGQATIQVPWQVAAPDTHEIEVSVSPYVFASEASYANNVAARTVVLGTTTGVGPRQLGSGRLWLAPPRPNPARGSVTFAFQLPEPGPATLELFDVVGRRIRRWSWEGLSTGTHTVDWDGRNQAGAMVHAGLVLCQLRSAGETRTRKLVFRP